MSETLIPAWDGTTLRPIDKLEVHRRGMRHPAVSVFAFCAGRLLIQKRAISKKHTIGPLANTCCTHPHWAESADDSARRRLSEKLGLTGVAPQHQGQITYRADVGNGLK